MQADLRQARHVVELMVLAAWADGRVAGSEAITIQKLANAVPLLHGIGPIADLCRATRERMLADGLDAVLASASAGLRDDAYRELALQCCARVMSADFVFAPEEDALMRKLQGSFGLGEDDVRRILVMATRQEI